MTEIFDGRGMKCPLAFVKAKQHLLKKQTRVFLLDDEVSLSNFMQYLVNSSVRFNRENKRDHVAISLRHDQS